jgi:hypothetical protein
MMMSVAGKKGSNVSLAGPGEMAILTAPLTSSIVRCDLTYYGLNPAARGLSGRPTRKKAFRASAD